MTGYTYPVGSGEITTTKDYLMRIIRAFGVAVEMRDLSADISATEELIVNKNEENSHRENLNAARRKMYQLKKLNAKSWLELARPHLGYTDHPWASSPDDKATQRRLGKMCQKVHAWQPADGQQEVKDFALSQLKESLDFGRHSVSAGHSQYQNALSFRQKTLKAAQRAYNYHRRELRWAIARNHERTQSFRDFIASIEGLD